MYNPRDVGRAAELLRVRGCLRQAHCSTCVLHRMPVAIRVVCSDLPPVPAAFRVAVDCLTQLFKRPGPHSPLLGRAARSWGALGSRTRATCPTCCSSRSTSTCRAWAGCASAPPASGGGAAHSTAPQAAWGNAPTGNAHQLHLSAQWPNLRTCRPPLPAAFTRQRRGWATRHLVVESEPGADSLLPLPGASGAPGQPGGGVSPGASASQSTCLWTAGGTPSSWVWGAPGGGGGGQRGRGRVPRRQSTCQLELDASVEHILNRQQVWEWGAPTLL